MIGKTRQQQEVVFDAKAGPARGVLRRPAAGGKMKHTRRAPAPDLAPWIAHYWSVEWDLRGSDPHIAETLPHPNVQLVFENGAATVSGVQTSRFTRVLEGRSKVFGVKFRAGGFRAFYGRPVAELADRTVPATEIFGGSILELGAVVLGKGRERDRLKAADEFFRARRLTADPSAERAAELVERIQREPEIRTVDELAARAGIGKRALQRLFQEFVGASPKWVIRRYRLHEAVERIHSSAQIDLAQLAVELGYFDQAHLINDFRSIVGMTPGRYGAQQS
ncbi:MAG TPA: helix-turn-helix domain-containing protein [Bryobacteraceae bacterium]|jgi:AraC-like DNA-binding protein